MSDCIFCKIASGAVDARKVHEDDDVVAFHDLNPVAPTHVLIIPRKHIASLNEATDAERAILGALLLAARDVAGKLGLAQSGYRVVLNTMADAGQVVFHVHAHLLGGRPFKWPPG